MFDVEVGERVSIKARFYEGCVGEVLAISERAQRVHVRWRARSESGAFFSLERWLTADDFAKFGRPVLVERAGIPFHHLESLA